MKCIQFKVTKSLVLDYPSDSMMIFNDGWLADQTIDYLFVTELTEFGDKNVVLVKSVGI